MSWESKFIELLVAALTRPLFLVIAGRHRSRRCAGQLSLVGANNGGREERAVSGAKNRLSGSSDHWAGIASCTSVSVQLTTTLIGVNSGT